MPDLGKILENFLLLSNAESVTNLFLFTIIGTFVASLYLAYSGKAHSFTRYTPGLLTSLGILGTFIGIVIGLLDFNIKDIDGSIEALLAGLKTAFITSLSGMAGAIVFKVISTTKVFYENRVIDDFPLEVEAKDILKAIKDQDKKFDLLVKALSSDDESSLSAQIKLLRTDLNDQNRKLVKGISIQIKAFQIFSEKLWINLNDFAEILSKSATETIIEALKDVIVDFNDNLTEQFGDNFKALDASVKKLVDWQTNYGNQLEQMIAQYSQGVLAITDIEKAVSIISDETKSIPETMNSLKSVLTVNQHQIKELSNHLHAFKEIKENAVQAFPEIQAHIDKTIQGISLSSQKASDSYQLLLSNTEDVQKTFTKSIEKTQNQLESTVSELIEKQVSEMHKSFKALENEVQKSVDQTGQAVNNKLEMIDKSMSEEVTRVMTEMGGALASISGQFTQDYQELTRAMHKVTRSNRSGVSV